MRFSVEEMDEIRLIKLSGELSRAQANGLEHYIDDSITNGVNKFILDIEDLRFLDSATIVMLLRMTREALYAEGGIKLLRPRKSIKRFMSIGHVLELFECFDTKFEAVKSFDKPAEVPPAEQETYLQKMGKDQRAVIMHLAQILIKKDILNPDELIREMSRSQTKVISIYQKEIHSHHVPKDGQSDTVATPSGKSGPSN